ncbi:MAG: LPS assembly protein LptD [Alphaproteobacteria bacterium]|nr:LPS assembly protein LptD [Alphaproteobacteria bacterium]
MNSRHLLKRALTMSACLWVVPIANPCLAAPPIGYTGPVPREDFLFPVGYTGPVPRRSGLSLPELPPQPIPTETAKTEEPILIAAREDEGLPVQTPPSAENDSPSEESEYDKVLISADEMHTDDNTGLVTAKGHVEMVYKDFVLHADSVSYNQKTGVLAADGNIALLTPSGEVEFADHQELTRDMAQAFAKNVGVLFPDNSRLAARSTQKYNNRYTVANKAMYTACNICRENPDNPPLWQMRAKTVTHDTARHKLYYHNATLDFAGVPVAYTPYMSAPDPSVKRLEGFLSPVPGVSANIGDYIKIPYYVDIAPDKDLTLTPTFSTKDTLQVDTLYRERFENGILSLNGSLTHAQLINENGLDKGRRWRGHMFGIFKADLDNVWRMGSDIQYASDKSYLQRYTISSLDQTTSRLYLEGFKGRNYIAANSYYFQDLRADSDVSEPLIIPSIAFSALGDPRKTWGGRWSFDAGLLVTARDNGNKPLAERGADTRRLSLKGGWERDFVSTTGLRTTVSALLRSESYWANDVVSEDKTTLYNRALFTRGFGQLNTIMRYPLGRTTKNYQHLLEPIVALTLAPNVRSIAKQPLEDSWDVEFDETNLFSPNRFTGNDLIEGGSRVTYGLRNAVTSDSGARIDIFGGASYRFTSDSMFSERSGLRGRESDFVGRIDFTPTKWLDANYGFRLSKNDLAPQRQDAFISVGQPVFRPYARYIQAYQHDTSTNLYSQVRQITVGFSSSFAKYWTLSGHHIQAFDPQPGPRNSSLALTYADECFAFGISLTHDNTDRADLSSGTSVAFHFYFKNLGGLHTDAGSNISFPEKFRQTAP